MTSMGLTKEEKQKRITRLLKLGGTLNNDGLVIFDGEFILNFFIKFYNLRCEIDLITEQRVYKMDNKRITEKNAIAFVEGCKLSNVYFDPVMGTTEMIVDCMGYWFPSNFRGYETNDFTEEVGAYLTEYL